MLTLYDGLVRFKSFAIQNDSTVFQCRVICVRHVELGPIRLWGT
jgi:hypothetical protein